MARVVPPTNAGDLGAGWASGFPPHSVGGDGGAEGEFLDFEIEGDGPPGEADLVD